MAYPEILLIAMNYRLDSAVFTSEALISVCASNVLVIMLLNSTQTASMRTYCPFNLISFLCKLINRKFTSFICTHDQQTEFSHI